VRRAYRRHTVRYAIAALWAVPVVVLGMFALDLSPDGVPVPPGDRLILALIALPFLVLAVRTFRIGVFTRPDGVIVRGVMRTRHVPWERIGAFEWGHWGGFECGVIRLTDGSQVTVFALNPPFEIQAGQDRRVPELLAGLNEELAKARGWAEAPPSRAPGPAV